MSDFVIKRTGAADYPRFLKIMVMGPAKSGKSTFISTAPNVLIGACEAGLMSIAHKNLAYVEIDEAPKLEVLLAILQDPAMRKNVAAQNGMPLIETVAIDTLDAYQDTLKKQILLEARRSEMQQADWGKLKERMATILKAFVALPMNVIFTVHTDITTDENGRQIYAPALQGSIKNEVAGLVDFSLMSGREKQTLPDGTSKIVYFLKNEGDEKNPHLGNRSAGRVPEISEPDFKVLHKLTFDAIHLPQTEESTTLNTEQMDNVLAGSGSRGLSEVPAPVQINSSAIPTGKPLDDDGNPINTAGLSAITKSYQGMDFVVPADLATWTLGEARQISKIFAATKAEIAAGRANKRDLATALAGVGHFDGDVDVALGPKVKKASTAKSEPVKSETTVKPEAKPAENSSSDEKELAAAIDEVDKNLGGVVIGIRVTKDATCAECGNTIDDLEVAQLAASRFRKVLCVEHYRAISAASTSLVAK